MSKLTLLPDTFMERQYFMDNMIAVAEFLYERTEEWAIENELLGGKKEVVEKRTNEEARLHKAAKQLLGNGINGNFAMGILQALATMVDDNKTDLNKVYKEIFQSQNHGGNKRYQYIPGIFLKCTVEHQPKYMCNRSVYLPKNTVFFYVGGEAETNAVFVNPERVVSKREKTQRIKNLSLAYFNVRSQQGKIIIPTFDEIQEFLSNLCESETKGPIQKVYKTLEKINKE